ncbi:MAG TPA: serine hydrolase [Thermoanaerobaculia bacterium]|nr:serine hydrolase [Thermoanaerobaculia bacterium]
MKEATTGQVLEFRQQVRHLQQERLLEALEVVLAEELGQAIGAASYERAARRRGYRNGVELRRLTTVNGAREVQVPRGRLQRSDGSTEEFRSELLPRYARRMQEIDDAILSCYLAGANTRRIRLALQPLLGDEHLSKSAVSRVVGRLKALFAAWSQRDLSGESYAVLFLDGFHLKVRLARRVVSLRPDQAAQNRWPPGARRPRCARPASGRVRTDFMSNPAASPTNRIPMNARGRRAAPLLAAAIVLAACASVPASQRAAPSRLDSYLRKRALGGDFSGSVIVERNGRALLNHGYGKADYELGGRNDDRKIFRIGSLSKPFTAVAIMRLQEESKLSINDPLCRFLKPCPASWAPVTLRQLLSHTSGIPDYFGEVSAGPTSKMRDLIDQVIHAHLASTLVSEPGASFRYSNFGYLLLGYVCEVVSGQPWELVLRSRIFEPAGMVDTGYDDIYAVVPGRVRGYDRANGVIRNIVYKDHGAFAAGGLRSTARDLLAWQYALAQGKLLRASSLEEMFTAVRDDYALGWQSISLFRRRVVNHTGEIDGFASHLAYYRDDGLVIIVLSNFIDEPAKTTACDLARIVFGEGATVLDRRPSPTPPSGEQLDRLVGTYSDGNVTRNIERSGSGLVYRGGDDRIELVAVEPDQFQMGRTRMVAFDPDRNALKMIDGCGTTIATMKRLPQP